MLLGEKILVEVLTSQSGLAFIGRSIDGQAASSFSGSFPEEDKPRLHATTAPGIYIVNYRSCRQPYLGTPGHGGRCKWSRIARQEGDNNSAYHLIPPPLTAGG